MEALSLLEIANRNDGAELIRNERHFTSSTALGHTTDPSLTMFSAMEIRHTFTIGAFALFLALAPATPLVAQPSQSVHEETNHPQWTTVLGEQVRMLLESGDVNRQEDAMLLILQYAQRPDLKIDFQPAVPALLSIYESDADEGHRLIALSALNAVGSEPVLSRLAERVINREEPSERVKRHTLRVLTVRSQHGGADQ